MSTPQSGFGGDLANLPDAGQCASQPQAASGLALEAGAYRRASFEGHSVPEQLAMIAERAQTAYLRLHDVLDAIANAPVDRKVAKVARKARLRR